MSEILIASDHAGYKLKYDLTRELKIKNKFHDLGTSSQDSVDYPDFAIKLSRLINTNKFEKGILICGSGIGMSMVANRFENIRAALCLNEEMAKLARQHNNANILVLGSRLISVQEAIKCTIVFMKTDYEGGRHQARLDKFNFVE